MGLKLGEVFCFVCGKSSNDDNGNFHKKDGLCNRHWIQIKRHGKPTGKERYAVADKKSYCEICGDVESTKNYVWSKDGDLKGKTLCNKHYTQMLRHGYLLDKTPSEHQKRILWTDKEKEDLEEYYKRGLSFEEISNLINRSVNSINTMSSQLKLGDKYMRSNNVNFKAVYQDYDWCYERYVNRGMSHQEMADECNASLRVIQKWCSEIHKLHNNSFKEHKHLTDIQKQVIMFSMLGDGHIDRREDQPMFIEVHAENQKDYLYWKYNFLKDICKQEPSYIPPKQNVMIMGKSCNIQGSYRINTKIINELKEIRSMTYKDIIPQLNELGLAIHFLDDAYRSRSSWNICLAEYSQEEIDLYIKTLKDKFNLFGKQYDSIYMRLNSDSSRKLDKIILSIIPNDLDIIQYKIINNCINKENNYFYIFYKDRKIGLAAYCKQNKIPYKLARNMVNDYKLCDMSENDFLELLKQYKGEVYG